MSNFYSKLAPYYDHIYSELDYRSQAVRVHEIIQEFKKTGGNRLLDVACGTGTHIKYLVDTYEATGFDLSSEMLVVAREKCPSVEFIQGNMVDLNLGRKFDIITCLFGSIGYLTKEGDLVKTIKHFAEHIVTGGVVIIEPMFTKETYHEGFIGISCVDLPEIKIARVNATKRVGEIAYLNFEFLISTRDNGIEHFMDPSPIGLFSRNTFLSIMADNRLSTNFVEPGLVKEGFFIGVKQ